MKIKEINIMIPNAYIPRISMEESPDVTWRLGERDILNDRIDRLAAVRQTVWLILNVERCRYIIYSWNYGVELEDLFGQQISFVRPEVERRIRDALIQDNRITDVDGFSFERRGKTLHVTFTVHTIFGDFRGERVVW
jgi:hypothetical protein